MTVITTRLIVAADGSVSVSTPLPAGEYVAQVKVEESEPYKPQPFDMSDWPSHDTGPWPEGLDKALRREDIYGDDGR